MQALLESPMAKRNDVPVKVDADVIRVAKIAAAYKGISLAEYLSETLRPIVSRDVESEHAKVVGAKKGKKPERGVDS
jgi:hypothetical protein